MSVQLPNGATVEIAASYGSEITMSALSNSDPAVADLGVAHGVAAGDFIEVTSGWSKLTNKIVRVLANSDEEVRFEDIDTSSTTRYPAGGGTGTVREITA